MTSPTQRTLAQLRKEGYESQVVERWCGFSRRRIDLFEVIDVVAIRADSWGVLGVQATSGPNVASRATKIRATPAARVWLQAGNRLVVHGWAKRGKPARWACRVVEITLADFAEVSRDAAG